MANNCLKVGIAVTGLLLVIATITSLIPDCQEGRNVTFESPVSGKLEVPCGAHEMYTIHCNYSIYNTDEDIRTTTTGIPQWFINSTIYTAQSSDIPAGFDIRGTSLVVTNGRLPGVNNTLFFCRVQLGTQSNPMSCTYNSSEGELVIKACEAPRVECLPVYSLTKNGHLLEIHTQLNITELIKGDTIAAGIYTLVYFDALGNECSSSTIPVSNCTGGICKDVFEVTSASPLCSNTPNIIMNVSITNLDESNIIWKSEIITIDSVNRLVGVFIDKSDSGKNSKVICNFLGEVAEFKYCVIEHGPLTSDCRNLPAQEPVIVGAGVYATGFMEANDLDLSYLGNDTKFCISVTAKSGNKEWKVEGIYEVTAESDSTTRTSAALFTQTNLRFVGAIELFLVIRLLL